MWLRNTSALSAALLCTGFCLTCGRQLQAANVDESKVPAYTLPDPLTCQDGTKVTDPESWRAKRRPELLELLRTNQYGRSPGRPAELKFEVESTDKQALSGLATRKQITVRFWDDKQAPAMHLLLYAPSAAKQPAPVFLGVNFEGNQTLHRDPGIKIIEQWAWDNKNQADSLVLPKEETRGANASNWAVETLLRRGYAVATFSRPEIEPDYPSGWKHGVRGFWLQKSGQSELAPDDWGAIGAWAWSLGRAVDYLETDADVDAKRIAVFGHSRLGKTALWAGAQDERIALVISNNSGEGGAALARRDFGETTAAINRVFPHWFCGNFKQYSDRSADLPTDQHEVLALIAPRPLYVASASEDLWADPRGEFLSARQAGPVYKLFGKTGVEVDDMPSVDQPVGDTIGYHVRSGKHDVTEYDWEQYLKFADRHFGRDQSAK